MRAADNLRSLVLGPFNPKDPNIARYFGGSPVSSGVSVSEDTALDYAPVWAAVNLISSDVASLPLILYKREPNGGKTRYVDAKLYKLLHDEPNPEMTAFVFRETLQAHVLLWGNAYAEIERDSAGRPMALWPIAPHRVEPYRPTVQGNRLGAMRYRIDGNDGVTLPASDVIHIPGLSPDGSVGYRFVLKARESIGLGVAMERFGGTFFGNGSTFGGVLSHPRTLSKQAEENLRNSIQARHQGPDRAHKFLIIQEDMKYEALGVAPNQAQFIESRRFQIAEVARWFRVPPHKIGDLERATFSNIEQQALEYVVGTLRPWLVRWEQEFNRKLISPLERNRQFCEHLVDGMLRGDVVSRNNAYAVGRQWGWLSADDVREKENLNPLPNGAGQIYLVPFNMTPADKVNELVDSQIEKNTQPKSTNPLPGQRELDAIIASLRDDVAALTAKADAQMARATEAETIAATATTDAAVWKTAAETARDGLAATQRELAEKTALLLVAQEQAEQERRERQTAIQHAHALEVLNQYHIRDKNDALARVEESERKAQEAEAARLAAEARAEIADRNSLEAEQRLAEAQKGQESAEQWLLMAKHAATEAAQAQARAESQLQQAYSDASVGIKEAEELRQALAAANSALVEAETELEAIVGQKTEEAEALLARANELQASRDAAIAALVDAEAKVQTAEAEHRAAITAAEGAILERKEREGGRLTSVLAAHRGLLVDAMGRMIRRETEKARRHQTTPQKLRAWMENFYATHEETCVEAILPAITTHLAWCGSDEIPITVAARHVQAHIAESIRQLAAVVDGSDPDEYHAVLERTLERWERDRPSVLADAILRDEIEYVRSYQ